MASSKSFFFTLAMAASLLSSFSSAVQITHDGRSLMFDGQRKLVISGSIHYPRSTPEMWPDLIAKAKEGGLDTIETYVFWNAHEPQQGKYNFEGNLNLVRFIKEIKSAGLNAILRIGPYVCAEWNHGGLPGWLQQIDGMQVRTDNQAFKDAMQKFTTLIVNMVKEQNLLATQGGPIILTQIENEYGNVISSYGDAGKRYIQWCANLAVSLNVSVPWIMCQEGDAPEPMMNTCNGFYCDSFAPKDPTTPQIWTENWTGWFKNWDQPDPHRPAEDVAFAVARFFQFGGAAQNYYMYHGGTNFGRTSGGPYIVTSYDYDAPLGEYGNLNQPKWGHLKRLHENLRKMENALLYGKMSFTFINPNVNVTMYSGNNITPACFLSNNNTVDYTVNFQNKTYFLPAWSVSLLPDCIQETYNTAKVNTQTTVMIKKPSEADPTNLTWQWTPEFLGNHIRGQNPILKRNQLLEQVHVTGDASDYLWYITSVEDLPEGQATLSVKTNGHGIYAFVNGTLIGSQYAKKGHYNFTFVSSFTVKAGLNVIALLSSTVGLQNYGQFYDATPTGIAGGPVTLIVGNRTIDLSNFQWSYMLGLDGEDNQLHFNTPKKNQLHFKNRRLRWQSGSLPINKPFTWYKANFQAPLGNDPVVVDLQGMGKGVAWVNGENLGRFWTNVIANGSCTACDYRGSFNAGRTCNTGCNMTGQRWYHVPREYLHPGTLNTLTLFEEAGGDPTAVHFQNVVPGTICGSIYEQDTVELSCQGGRISRIDYASFGNPQGACQAFTNGTCDIPQMQDKISRACVGKPSCSITADQNLMLGQGSPCDSIPLKRLAVQATCN